MKYFYYNRAVKVFLLIVTVFTTGVSQAQEARSTELYKTLKNRDSLIFEVGFNQCDLTPYDTLISEDLEFYHDKGGATYGKAAFINTTKQNICNGNFKPRRELVDSSLQVFAMYDKGILYAAVQQGVHRFYVKEQEKWKYTGAAKFTHFWIMEQGHWRLKRVLSYDH